MIVMVFILVSRYLTSITISGLTTDRTILRRIKLSKYTSPVSAQAYTNFFFWTRNDRYKVVEIWFLIVGQIIWDTMRKFCLNRSVAPVLPEKIELMGCMRISLESTCFSRFWEASPIKQVPYAMTWSMVKRWYSLSRCLYLVKLTSIKVVLPLRIVLILAPMVPSLSMGMRK